MFMLIEKMLKSIPKNIASFLQKLAILYRATFLYIFSLLPHTLTKLRKTCSKVAKRLSPTCCGDRLCCHVFQPVATNGRIYGKQKFIKMSCKFCCECCQKCCGQGSRVLVIFEKNMKNMKTRKKIMLTNLNF